MNKSISLLIAISIIVALVWGVKQYTNEPPVTGIQTKVQNVKEQTSFSQQNKHPSFSLNNQIVNDLSEDEDDTQNLTKKQKTEQKQTARREKTDQRRQEREKQREEKRLARGQDIIERTPMTEAQRQASLERREEIQQKMHEQALDNIDSEDDSIRLDAVGELTPNKPTELKLLLDHLATDTDPTIREEAAGMLSFGEHPSTISNLITALSDAEPKVIVAAVEALSWYDDNSKAIEAVRDLKDHTDSRVREEVENFLGFVE